MHCPKRRTTPVAATFWCEVLDFKVIDRSEGKVEIGSWVPTVEDVRARPMSPTRLFIQVPEGETVKNRLHLDASPIDGSTEDEVTGLLGLGATKTDVGQGSDRNCGHGSPRTRRAGRPCRRAGPAARQRQ
nr:VOC family protein [Streptomyces sp. NBC_01800]